MAEVVIEVIADIVLTQNGGTHKTYYGVDVDVAVGDEITRPLPCERFTVSTSWSPFDGTDDDDEPIGARCF